MALHFVQKKCSSSVVLARVMKIHSVAAGSLPLRAFNQLSDIHLPLPPVRRTGVRMTASPPSQSCGWLWLAGSMAPISHQCVSWQRAHFTLLPQWVTCKRLKMSPLNISNVPHFHQLLPPKGGQPYLLLGWLSGFYSSVPLALKPF